MAILNMFFEAGVFGGPAVDNTASDIIVSFSTRIWGRSIDIERQRGPYLTSPRDASWNGTARKLLMTPRTALALIIDSSFLSPFVHYKPVNHGLLFATPVATNIPPSLRTTHYSMFL
ncbi:Uncharacterized protein HZ326_17120 [Fusarium oxysporum f. sp. albedinis]|nr:Uncharacterized protein HZ326_17120 [Fusarium oxysporum f. sp. albedinis]